MAKSVETLRRVYRRWVTEGVWPTIEALDESAWESIRSTFRVVASRWQQSAMFDRWTAISATLRRRVGASMVFEKLDGLLLGTGHALLTRYRRLLWFLYFASLVFLGIGKWIPEGLRQVLAFLSSPEPALMLAKAVVATEHYITTHDAVALLGAFAIAVVTLGVAAIAQTSLSMGLRWREVASMSQRSVTRQFTHPLRSFQYSIAWLMGIGVIGILAMGVLDRTPATIISCAIVLSTTLSCVGSLVHILRRERRTLVKYHEVGSWVLGLAGVIVLSAIGATRVPEDSMLVEVLIAYALWACAVAVSVKSIRWKITLIAILVVFMIIARGATNLLEIYPGATLAGALSLGMVLAVIHTIGVAEQRKLYLAAVPVVSGVVLYFWLSVLDIAHVPQQARSTVWELASIFLATGILCGVLCVVFRAKKQLLSSWYFAIIIVILTTLAAYFSALFIARFDSSTMYIGGVIFVMMGVCAKAISGNSEFRARRISSIIVTVVTVFVMSEALNLIEIVPPVTFRSATLVVLVGAVIFSTLTAGCGLIGQSCPKPLVGIFVVYVTSAVAFAVLYNLRAGDIMVSQKALISLMVGVASYGSVEVAQLLRQRGRSIYVMVLPVTVSLTAIAFGLITVQDQNVTNSIERYQAGLLLGAVMVAALLVYRFCSQPNLVDQGAMPSQLSLWLIVTALAVYMLLGIHDAAKLESPTRVIVLFCSISLCAAMVWFQDLRYWIAGLVTLGVGMLLLLGVFELILAAVYSPECGSVSGSTLVDSLKDKGQTVGGQRHPSLPIRSCPHPWVMAQSATCTSDFLPVHPLRNILDTLGATRFYGRYHCVLYVQSAMVLFAVWKTLDVLCVMVRAIFRQLERARVAYVNHLNAWKDVREQNRTRI